jgi:hypothetical protein
VPNTQSKEVNLTKRVQTSKGMRYCPAVLSPNGRVKPDLVIVNGRPERHSEGGVLLGMARERQAHPTIRGERPQDAAARRQRKEAELNALKQWGVCSPRKRRQSPFGRNCGSQVPRESRASDCIQRWGTPNCRPYLLFLRKRSSPKSRRLCPRTRRR